MVSPVLLILGGLGIILIGISKTGFGGGGGNLATPLMALIASARESVAILLPILCIADLFSLWLYRGKWDVQLVKNLLPTTFIGIVAGSLLLGMVPDTFLKKILGLIAIGFVLLQFFRYRLLRPPKVYTPKKSHTFFIGGLAGLFSTLAHAAGPILSIFLLPIKLRKEVFVANTVIYFAIVNYTKLMPYLLLGIFDYHSLLLSGILLPFAPLGVYLGFRLNRRLSRRRFTLAIYILLLATGVQLLTGFNIVEISIKPAYIP